MYVPPSLITSNSAFRIYRFLMLLIINSDYISLTSINQFMFVIVKCGFLFQVLTEFLNII
jgi:hypothetical protein